MFVISRELNIKELQTHDGLVLDLEDTVGDTFDDRDANGNNRLSTVKVLRYPPTAEELNNPQRFSSLLPESSARPKKRPITSHSSNARDRLQHLTSIEDWGTGRLDGANKRQKTQDSLIEGILDPDQPIPSHEGQGVEGHHSSQPSGTQGSVHQVYDSQRSPPRKRKGSTLAP